VRQLIRALLRKLVHVDIVFSAVLLTARFAEFCIRQKYAPSAAASGSIEQFISSTFPDFLVRRGPFKGLRFPRGRLTPSLAPKLIGSYEREIAELIEKLCSENWSAIVDIGCAEGYYAVGLALRVPGAIVHAYDANPNMMRSCRETAELNGVESRIRIGSFLTSETLNDLALGSKALVISDCEGHEYSIFTSEVIGKLEKHDVLIELHDATRGALTSHLIRKFSPTHIPQIIRSIDDWRKPLLYEYVELAGLDEAARMKILAEARGDQMEWLYCTPRAIDSAIAENSPLRVSSSAKEV
jgi:predicted O-methyltransferase YrrM